LRSSANSAAFTIICSPGRKPARFNFSRSTHLLTYNPESVNTWGSSSRPVNGPKLSPGADDGKDMKGAEYLRPSKNWDSQSRQKMDEGHDCLNVISETSRSPPSFVHRTLSLSFFLTCFVHVRNKQPIQIGKERF
jgi:hypothetical protein